jgi:hypothetical protein
MWFLKPAVLSTQVAAIIPGELMSPGERLQNARLPVSSTKRKNPEGVAEASASAQVSHRRVMQLVAPIEQMIFKAGAGDDARTGKIFAELQKRPALKQYAGAPQFSTEQQAAMHAGYAAQKTVEEIREKGPKMTMVDKSVLKCTGISCSTGTEAQDRVLGRQAHFFGYHGTHGRIKFRDNFVKPRAEIDSTDNRSLQTIVTRKSRSDKIDGDPIFERLYEEHTDQVSRLQVQ